MVEKGFYAMWLNIRAPGAAANTILTRLLSKTPFRTDPCGFAHMQSLVNRAQIIETPHICINTGDYSHSTAWMDVFEFRHMKTMPQAFDIERILIF
jgi:hypothetical protein